MQLRVLCQADISPSLSLATDQFFLQTAGETQTAVLRVYTYPGDVVLLGRYHGVDQLAETDQVTLSRRLSGGRVLPSGQGFVQFSFILPHRSAFFSDEPFYLAPFQVLNRYVRSIMQGFKAAGVNMFYPGRDFLTIDQQPVGWVSFTTEHNGALLVEGGLAVQRDFSLLPYLLDGVDPTGTISSQFFAPDQVTSLERIAGKPPSLSQLATLLQHGFCQQSEIACVNQDLQDLQDLNQIEQEHIARIADEASSGDWLHSWSQRDDLPFHATATTPLGSLNIRFSVAGDETLADVHMSGDFIASPDTITTLQSSLKGRALEYTALWEVVDQTFLQPQHYILGLRRMRIIPDTILRGYTASPSSPSGRGLG